MFNYTIDEKSINLSAMEVLNFFQTNLKREAYDNIIKDISNKIERALDDKPRNEVAYLDVWYKVFDRCTRRGCEHLVADFEDMGLTVQLIPYFDNHEIVKRAILSLLPKGRDSVKVQPIEYAVIHETLGLFIVMPLEKWCPTWVEEVENYAYKDEIVLVHVVEAKVHQCKGAKISLAEYQKEREKYIVLRLELTDRRMKRRVPLGYVAGKVYYFKMFYPTPLGEPSTEPFISKEETEKRICFC